MVGMVLVFTELNLDKFELDLEIKKELMLRHERSRLKEEMQKKMSERFRLMEVLRKKEIMSQQVRKDEHIKAQKLGTFLHFYLLGCSDSY